MTTPVTGIITTPPPTASPTAAKKNDLLDPQAFLQLLVTQLQYQDPSNPTDTSTFLNQTAMLSQVQTMNGMSDTLASLTATQQGQAATGLIGKQITYLDLAGATKTGVVDSATIEGGTATLKIGNASVTLDKVLSVANAPAS
jgi:flagellar basal-body rod modification protein FlgD